MIGGILSFFFFSLFKKDNSTSSTVKVRVVKSRHSRKETDHRFKMCPDKAFTFHWTTVTPYPRMNDDWDGDADDEVEAEEEDWMYDEGASPLEHSDYNEIDPYTGLPVRYIGMRELLLTHTLVSNIESFGIPSKSMMPLFILMQLPQLHVRAYRFMCHYRYVESMANSVLVIAREYEGWELYNVCVVALPRDGDLGEHTCPNRECSNQACDHVNVMFCIVRRGAILEFLANS